jgi:hypothetical protein
MDFYVIPPNKHLDLMHKANRYFCLAHFYIADPAYRQYFLTLREQEPCFITLDNAAAEKHLVTQEALLDIVEELRPDEVIAPDYLFDKQKTLNSFYSFADALVARKLSSVTNLFACPQGSTEEEWLTCFEEMQQHPLVSVLGLSKIAVPYCFADGSTGDVNIASARQKCIRTLLERGLLNKDIHLLGMGDPTEYDYYFRIIEGMEPEFKGEQKEALEAHLRSSDSCYSILAAWHGVDFEAGNFKRVPTTEDYYSAQLTRDQLYLAESNIKFLVNRYCCSF